MKTFIEQIIEDNEKFVDEKKYEKFEATKYPNKKIAIISCMDARLSSMLPAALNLKNGDVQIIKNAGGMITNEFGTVMRSLMVAIYKLGVKDIMVIGHTDCGMKKLESVEIENKMRDRGISQNTLESVRARGVDINEWLKGFDDEESYVSTTVDIIKEHPFIPADIGVYGFMMDIVTGKISEVK